MNLTYLHHSNFLTHLLQKVPAQQTKHMMLTCTHTYEPTQGSERRMSRLCASKQASPLTWVVYLSADSHPSKQWPDPA